MLRMLRRDFPIHAPLRVVRRRIAQGGRDEGTEYAYATEGVRGFTIVLHKTLGAALLVELLLHEYAHVLCWASKPDHSRQWAATYAKLRRWFQLEGEYEPKAGQRAASARVLLEWWRS